MRRKTETRADAAVPSCSLLRVGKKPLAVPMATGLLKDIPTLEDATQKQLMRVMEDNATLRVAAELAVPSAVLELLYTFSSVSFHTPDGAVMCYQRSLTYGDVWFMPQHQVGLPRVSEADMMHVVIALVDAAVRLEATYVFPLFVQDQGMQQCSLKRVLTRENDHTAWTPTNWASSETQVLTRW
jgi:hypothetical protein